MSTVSITSNHRHRRQVGGEEVQTPERFEAAVRKARHAGARALSFRFASSDSVTLLFDDLGPDTTFGEAPCFFHTLHLASPPTFAPAVDRTRADAMIRSTLEYKCYL